MHPLRDKYAIVGTGKSPLGQIGLNSMALLEIAIQNALDDAGLTVRDVDGLVVRGADDIYAHHQVMAERLVALAGLAHGCRFHGRSLGWRAHKYRRT